MELEQALGKELLQQVTEKLGGKSIIIDDGMLIPKSRFDEVNTAKNQLQTQIETLQKAQADAVEKAVTEYKKQLDDVGKKLKGLEKITGDNEELSKQLTEYQAQLKSKADEFEQTRKTEKEQFEQQLKQQKKDLLLENRLIKAQAEPTKAVKALLDMEKISIDGDNLLGLDEQIDGIKKNYPRLFGETILKTPTPNLDQKTPPGLYSKEQIAAMSDADMQANIDTVIKSLSV